MEETMATDEVRRILHKYLARNNATLAALETEGTEESLDYLMRVEHTGATLALLFHELGLCDCAAGAHAPLKVVFQEKAKAV